MALTDFVLPEYASSPSKQTAVYGSEAQGLPIYSEDPATIVGGTAWAEGIGGATNATFKLPALNDDQAMYRVLCQAIRFGKIAGIPIWISGIPYQQYSICQHAGIVYQNKTGSYTTNNPAIDTTNWETWDSSSKVNLNGDNATFSSLANTAKENISNTGMPDYSSSVAKAMNTDETAASDGVIWGYINTQEDGQYAEIKINGITLYSYTFASYSDVSIPFNYKVKKGQVYQHYNSQGTGHGTINFAPMYAIY